MADEFVIRQFQKRDAAACCSLIHSCVERDPQMSAALREKIRMSETPATMLRRSELFYMAVCESAGGILGVGGLEMNEIRLLYVAPEHQGRGIGSALLRHLESMIPPALFGDVFVYSTFAAVDFYGAHGFKAGGEFAFDFGGEQLMTVFMTKQQAAEDCQSPEPRPFSEV